MNWATSWAALAIWFGIASPAMPAPSAPLEITSLIGDGRTDDRAGINAAIAAAAAVHGVARLPAGTFRIAMDRGGIILKSAMTLEGAGMGRTVILCDENAGNVAGVCVTNPEPVVGLTIRGVTFQGRRPRDVPISGTNAATVVGGDSLLVINHGRDVVVESSEFLDSRGFGVGVFGVHGVAIRQCRVRRSGSDGIAIWADDDIAITENVVEQAGDDAISAHANDADAAPVRAGMLIRGNLITDSLGSISILGAKSAIVSGNILRRNWNSVNIAFSSHFSQGNTPDFAISVTDNIVEDMIQVNALNPYEKRPVPYLLVSGAQSQAADGSAAPGRPTPGSGRVTSLYGSGAGSLYANAQANHDDDGVTPPGRSVPSPGGRGIRIVGNILMRSLPAVARFADWGVGEGVQVGRYGYFTGAVSEAALSNNVGIKLGGTITDAVVSGNRIRTGGVAGIVFDDIARNGDYDGLDITENSIGDVSRAGILWTANGVTHQRIRVAGNRLDIDPLFRSQARGPHGGWTGPGPVGLSFSRANGIDIEQNHIWNATAPLDELAAGVFLNKRGNVLHGRPAALGFSPANGGIGTVLPDGAGWRWDIEESDPASPNYGATLNETLTEAPAQPGSGIYVTGHFVASVPPGHDGTTGWVRLTTGAGHVAAEDWMAVRGGR